MSFVVLTAGVVFGFMLAELRVARRHEQALRRAGAIAPAGDIYWAIATLYPAAFALMASEGAWMAWRGLAPSSGPSWVASGVVLFAASKIFKYWAVRSLGDRWTFRVLVVPGCPLVRDGPYRYMAHPNYLAVIGELLGAAMMFGARVTGPVSMAAFGVALGARIRFESRILREYERSGS